MTELNDFQIKHDRLELIRVDEGGVQRAYFIGARQARADIRQIETSTRDLAASTRRRLAILKAGISAWEARG